MALGNALDYNHPHLCICFAFCMKSSKSIKQCLDKTEEPWHPDLLYHRPGCVNLLLSAAAGLYSHHKCSLHVSCKESQWHKSAETRGLSLWYCNPGRHLRVSSVYFTPVFQKSFQQCPDPTTAGPSHLIFMGSLKVSFLTSPVITSLLNLEQNVCLVIR